MMTRRRHLARHIVKPKAMRQSTNYLRLKAERDVLLLTLASIDKEAERVFRGGQLDAFIPYVTVVVNELPLELVKEMRGE